MATRYYAPEPLTNYNVMKRADAAAKVTGKRTKPHPAMILRDRIHAAPSVKTVASNLAREAMTLNDDTDLTQWHTEALEQIREAQVADILRDSFTRAWDDAQRSVAATMLNKTIAESQETFQATAKALAEAAAHLPQAHPLDPEANISADTGTHLTKAREALATLAVFGSLFWIKTSDTVPPPLTRVLPVIDVPEPTVELRSTWHESLNPDQLTVTHTLRDLAKDLRDTPDEALVKVARGDYDGVKFSLATSAEYQQRIVRARNAFITRRAPNDG